MTRFFKIYSKRCLLVIASLVLCSGQLMAQDDLQEYINKISAQKNTRGTKNAPSDITEVDLSKFSAVNRETTLDVANGRNFRFVNGTLTRASSLNGPVIHVGGGSYVAIGKGADINSSKSSSSRETIYMDGGELDIESSGKVTNAANRTSVMITTNQDVFTTRNSSQVTGTIVCKAKQATITYDGGSLTHNDKYHFDSASDIVFTSYPATNNLSLMLSEKNNVVNLTNIDPPFFQISAPQKKNGDVVVKASRTWIQNKTNWGSRIKLGNSSKYQLVSDSKERAIKLFYDDLQDWIDNPDDKDKHCGCNEDDPYVLEVPCDGLRVKKNIEFPEDDLYWFINGQPEGQSDSEANTDCEKVINQGENDVVIKPGSHVYIRRIYWDGCGCANKHIWVYGTLHIKWYVYFYHYWRFIHVMPGGKVVVDDLHGNSDETVFHLEGGELEYNGGDSYGNEYGWYCIDGIIYIRGGELHGETAGGWTGSKGKSYQYDGIVYGGIHNYGWHYFYGGICMGGGSYTIYNYKGAKFYYYGGTCSDGGKIWNEGDLYIDGGGSVNCDEIYCVRGGRIYILKKLQFELQLIFEEKNIVVGEPIVLGAGNYKLTESDCKKIKIVLPEGYKWNFDTNKNCIVISSTNGIATMDAVNPTVQSSYDPIGRKTSGINRGVVVKRMNNGTIRKEIVK